MKFLNHEDTAKRIQFFISMEKIFMMWLDDRSGKKSHKLYLYSWIYCQTSLKHLETFEEYAFIHFETRDWTISRLETNFRFPLSLELLKHRSVLILLYNENFLVKLSSRTMN